MARMPEAEWFASPNYAAGAIGPIRGIQFHHTESSLQSALGWFLNPNSGASAHFIVGKNGRLIQCVDTADAAYAACQSNYEGWISIEFESWGDEALTAEQIATAARILKWAHNTHGVPFKVSTSRYDGGVSYHNMVPGPCSQAWGQTSCPGATIPTQRQAVVDAANPLPTTPNKDANMQGRLIQVKGKPDIVFVMGGKGVHVPDPGALSELVNGNWVGRTPLDGYGNPTPGAIVQVEFVSQNVFDMFLNA